MKMMKYPNVKNEINPTQSQHDVSPVYGYFKCQEKSGNLICIINVHEICIHLCKYIRIYTNAF